MGTTNIMYTLLWFSLIIIINNGLHIDSDDDDNDQRASMHMIYEQNISVISCEPVAIGYNTKISTWAEYILVV